jgi:hypothetical protein
VSELIPQETALHAQLAMIAGDEPEGSFVELRWRRARGMGQSFHRCQQPAPLLEVIGRLAGKTDVYVSAAPRVAQRGKLDAIARVWCLWADCDSDESVARLRAFRPRPSLVIRSGSRGHLHTWWALSHPLRPSFARAANRRLAWHLGADMVSVDAARVMRAAGTLNHKHQPPGVVECIHLDPQTYRTPEIVAQLEEHPANIPRRKPAAAPPAGDVANSVLGVLRVVREAPTGQRNSCLFWAACRLGEKIAAGGLDESSAADLLHSAAAACGLPESEAERTIRSGLNAGGVA